MNSNMFSASRRNQVDTAFEISSDVRIQWDLSARSPSPNEQDLESLHPITMNGNQDDDVEKEYSKISTGKGTDLSSGSTTPSRYAAPLGKKRAQVALSLRLEGPYFTAANPREFETVVCLVAGTGVTGAIAIAEAFSAHRKQWRRMPRYGAGIEGSARPLEGSKTAGRQPWSRCVVMWTVRADDYVEIPRIQGRVRLHRFKLQKQ